MVIRVVHSLRQHRRFARSLLIGNLLQKMMDAVEPRPLLVDRLDDPTRAPREYACAPASPPWPWCIASQRRRDSRSIGDSFHCFSGSWMRIWKRKCCSSSVIENQYLMQLDAGAHQHALELRHGAEELLDLVFRAEAHHPLDAGAIVPAAVEQHDLAARRQMRDVALEIPL